MLQTLRIGHPIVIEIIDLISHQIQNIEHPQPPLHIRGKRPSMARQDSLESTAMADSAAPKPARQSFDIEDVGTSAAIEGTEGLDVNHASRLRMQFLASQHASLVTQVQFADAKAAALMTLMGLVALNGPVKIGEASAHNIFAIGIFILMMIAIGCAMASIIPRYPDAKLNKLIKRRDRFSWPALIAQGYEPLDHAEFMRTAEASQLIMSIAQTNGAMARVLQSKFKLLRAAFILAAFDLLLIVLYVVGGRLDDFI